MASFVIRFAAADDAEVLYRFIKELAVYEREPDAVEVTPEILRSQLSAPRPPFECLIAEENREPLGFALFFHNYSTWRGRPGLYIEDLYVPECHRKRSVGKALFETLIDLAKERDCGRLEWSVLNWNEHAIDFYKSFGAEPLHEWTTFRLVFNPRDTVQQPHIRLTLEEADD